jgi:hypothetical protein
MSKISIEEVEAALRAKNVEPQIVNSIIKELNDVIEEEKDNRGGTPKQKNEFLIVINDPMGHISSLSTDFTGWVVTQKEGEDAGLVLDKIRQSAQDTNAVKKRKRNMITTFTEAMYGAKRFFLKSRNIAVKTKEPVRILITDNTL